MLDRPNFTLIYKGVNITLDVWNHLISCTYTDKVHGEADEIEVTLQDKDGIWRGPWCPEHGDRVQLWIGYEPAPLVYCGAFEIDEPAASLGRGGDTLTFRGVSAPVTKALRTRKTQAFEKQSLAQVAGKVAGEHGLSVAGSPPDITFDRITQRRQRPLEFLAELADAYGAYFSVRDASLYFAERKDLHEREPVLLFRADSDDYLKADLKRAAHKTYSKARATYFDGNSKKTIDVEVQDKAVKNGDTLRLDDRIENDGQARAMAKSKLEKANMERQTGNLELVGNPLILAGQTVELDAGFGRWAGRYLVKQSRHQMTRGGYTTNCEIATVDKEEAGKGGSGGAGQSGNVGKSVGTRGFASPSQRI
jgi:phage protein D